MGRGAGLGKINGHAGIRPDIPSSSSCCLSNKRGVEETENQGHSMADPAADLICRRCENIYGGGCVLGV